MKFRTLALMMMLLLLVVKLQGQSTVIDVQHYQFQVDLSDAHDSIKGQATVLIKFVTSTKEFSLDLKNIRDGKGMSVTGVRGALVKEYHHANDKIRLLLHSNFKAGDTASFTIDYKGIPADGLIISKNKYNKRTFFSDNWPNRAHHWLPCNDDVADKASVEFAVTAPVQYQVVSNGLQIEETNLPANKKLTRWIETVPLPTKIMVIGVAEFAVELAGMADTIPVYSWVYPENKNDGFYDYAIAVDVLQWFRKNIGPYPYRKLANVQSKTIFGGMENASAIFYSESSVKGNRSSEALIAHEIAHQWFGNSATEKSFAHLWLSEGFATYFTTLYMEQKYGTDTAAFMREEDRQQVISFSKKSVLPVVDTTTHNYMELLNANSYQKGGWVLHMLRKELGDSVFWTSIRNYFTHYAGKNASTHDLQKVIENTSGKKLDYFFQQWLYRAGHPHITLTWDYNSVSRTLGITARQHQQRLYNVPLNIQVVMGNGKIANHSLQINQAVQNFELPVSNIPVQIVADPGIDLLAFIETSRAAN